jgi:hypothetical protein
MIPESELARALARWKARKLGLPAPVATEHDDHPAPVFDEATAVAHPEYHSHLETPPAEVHLGEGDYEDHTRRATPYQK